MSTDTQATQGGVQVLESFSPGTGKKLGEVRCATTEDVRAAAARARAAQPGWAALGVEGRNRILRRLPGLLIDRASEITELVAAENGKALCEAAGLALPITEAVKLYTKMAERLERGVKVGSGFMLGAKSRIFYEPIGVVGYILPWNFPYELGMKHMVPALAAGNAVLQKPSEENPLIGDLCVRLFREIGVPEDVVQVVHGRGDVGQALIDEVNAVCFVGSPKTGRKVMARSAERLIPVVLELGGNDAAIVRADADLDHTAAGLVEGTCFNSGQVCNGIERIYVPRPIAPTLTEKIVAVVKRLRQSGAPQHDVGPVTWKPQVRIYEEHVADALAKGAVLVYGGEAYEQDGGLFWPPTVLTNMNHDMLMMREETFGPFLPIMEVDSDEEAVRLANDSQYGLGASVWTSDVDAGMAIARRLRTGGVVINNAFINGGNLNMPFGGVGESGVGRIQGEQGYFNFVEPKAVMTFGKSAAELWMPYPPTAEAMIRGANKLLYGRSIGERLSGAIAYLRNRSRN